MHLGRRYALKIKQRPAKQSFVTGSELLYDIQVHDKLRSLINITSRIKSKTKIDMNPFAARAAEPKRVPMINENARGQCQMQIVLM
jgi:hypothetical protein